MKHEDLVQTQGYWIVEIQNTFYKAVKKFQENEGLTLGQVAEKMEKSPSRLSQIMHGDFNPKLETLVKYALDLGYVPEVRFTPVQEFLDRKASKLGLKHALTNPSEKPLSRSPAKLGGPFVNFRLGERNSRTYHAPIFRTND